MSALLYLLSHKAKNRVKEIFHRPAELVLLLVGVALVVFVIFSGNMDVNPGSFRPRAELYAIIFALYALVFVLTAKNGFVNGASMFSMADVNLLFTGPNLSKTLLSYGLFSQMGRSLMLGVFILYQYSWVHNQYGATVADLFVILVGYAMTVFLGQMAAMLLYSFTSGSDEKVRIAKGVFYGIIAAFVLYFVYLVARASGDNILSRVLIAAASPVLHFFPAAGFLRLGVVGVMEGNVVRIAIGLGCFVGSLILYYVLVSVLNMDYYEDVLKATEVSFSAITARKEGKAQEMTPRNVKVGKTGLGKGWGASAIAQKHNVENRRGKVLLLDLASVIMAVVTIAFAFFIKEMIAGFAMSIYLLIMTIGGGRWSKELTLPYVYLMPEPPFKKLLFMLKEQVPVLLTQSVVTFIPFYFIFRCDWLTIIGFILGRTVAGFLFIGVDLLLHRWFGVGGNKALLIMLYFGLCMIAAVPGIVVAVVLYQIVFLPLAFCVLAMALFDLLLALLLLFFSRNVLSVSEFNNK
ncbi:MAG: putative ABC exporter domain-containing protein [Clostridia bacterium]|nr:putative ABC exporter domain-containing protein [Clostridia bacterium]